MERRADLSSPCFRAPNGRLWLSADREDLFSFDGTRVRPAPQSIHGVKVILADKTGSVWIGTKGGLARLDGERLRTFGPEDGFEGGDVRALAEDPEGAVWIASGDGTVSRYKAGRFVSFRPDAADGPHPIWSLLADADGTVWIGTFRGGLLRLRDGRFTRYTMKDGLPSNIICQILDDGAGQLWVGSYHGVFRVAKSALADHRSATAIPVVSYGRSDGLPTLECSGNYQPSAWKSRDGRLWFATPKGVVSVDPREPTIDRQPPTVVIEETRLDHTLVSASPLQIPPGPRRLEFQYTGLSLSTPEQVRFRYRLEGLESTWVEAGTQRSANYSYVPPGTYRFIVGCQQRRRPLEHGVHEHGLHRAAELFGDVDGFARPRASGPSCWWRGLRATSPRGGCAGSSSGWNGSGRSSAIAAASLATSTMTSARG